MPRLRLALVLALAAALVAAGPAPAAAPAAGDGAHVAAKKKRCKKGKVRLKERGKKARCVAARKVLPKPKAFDTARSATRFVLGADFSKLRDRRGRRLPSFPKLLDRIDPRADKALAAAAAATMKQLPQRELFARAAAAPCGAGSGSVSSTFNAGDGLSVDVRSTLGPDASMQLGMESRNGTRRVRFEVEFPSCSAASLDSCPTAAGIVRGRDDQRIGVRATLFEGDRTVWSQGLRLQGETTFRGVVGDDAKLQKVEVHNTEVATLALGGDSRGFDISIRTLVQRITTVTMPSGDFQLGASIVNANITGTGVSEGERRAAQAQIERDMRREADKQFRDIVKKAIDRYKQLETAWNQPNTCASVVFTPASGTKTLRRGDRGSFDARTQAKPGGSPATARWTLTGSANAPFTPGTASSNPSRFSHGPVTRAGRGVLVTAKLKSVSKAGVAEATWSQPTRDDGVINHIAGTFSGAQTIGQSVMSFSGDVAFNRSSPAVTGGASGHYALAGGGYTLTVSGLDVSGSTGCQMSGSGHITFPVGQSTMQVDGTPPAFGAPYTYSWEAFYGPTDRITATRNNCPDGAEGFEGTTFEINLFSPFRAIGRTSADGLLYEGTVTENLMTTTWRFTGTP